MWEFYKVTVVKEKETSSLQREYGGNVYDSNQWTEYGKS